MAMKFRAHETFFIRKGWLSKGMKAVKKDAAVFISKEKNPMDVLGIGSNMVKSMRYWMQAVGITEEPNKGKRNQSFTTLGEKIYEHDRYIDEDWTKNYTSNTVDTMAFVNMMQAVKSGESVDWKCPFCGGNIVLMKNEGGHTVIGCEECDMRINLESN